MTDRARFRQADVTRALKGAKAAGFSEVRLIIQPDGTMELIATEDGTTHGNVRHDEWADLR
jgi:hypothetical protein